MDTLKKYCEGVIVLADKAKSDFIHNFEQAPLHTFDWCQGRIEAISKGRICENILKALKAGVKESKIIEDLQESILTHSQWLPSSTSALSNLLEMIEQENRGKIFNEIKWYVILKDKS